MNAIDFDSTKDEEGFVHRGYGFPLRDREGYMTKTHMKLTQGIRNHG
jgi:hypothetical protein